MEITLSAVIEAARLRRAGVTAEVAGYVVLLAVRELMRAPRPVSTDVLLLTEIGELRLDDGRTPPATTDVEIEHGLRQLLASLTSLAQSVSPALKIAAERAAVGRLGALEAELMAALIPINHAAARRALARLYREAHKSRIESLSLAAASGTLSPPSPLVANVSPCPPDVDLGWRTPSPANVARVASPDAARLGADLDIEVDVVGFEDAVPASPRIDIPAPAASVPMSAGPVTASPDSAELESTDEPSSHRSDLGELLAGFLSHTRSEEQMTANLRRMIGLDAPPLPRPSSAPPPMFGAPTQAR